MERVRGAGGRAVKTTVERTLMRGLVTAFPCVRPAAWICQRASITIIGHTISCEGPRGHAPGSVTRMSVPWIGPFAGTGVVRLMGGARFNRVTDGPRRRPCTGNGYCRRPRSGVCPRSHQPAMTRGQTQLSLPGNSPDDCRQALLSDFPKAGCGEPGNGESRRPRSAPSRSRPRAGLGGETRVLGTMRPT